MLAFLYFTIVAIPVCCIVMGINLGLMIERAAKQEAFSTNVYFFTGALTIMMISIFLSLLTIF
jgi:hypothetical protein